MPHSKGIILVFYLLNITEEGMSSCFVIFNKTIFQQLNILDFLSPLKITIICNNTIYQCNRSINKISYR